ncbi:MAG: beta strand repeat-containing protein, partial [Acidimicrobiales bacterium]
TGGLNPTGTVTFNLFGPNDATCAGPAVFTSTVPVTGAGAVSANFTTTAAGTYRFTASYSGDTNNNPAGPTACNDPAEAVVVTPATPALSTNASASVPVGGTIHDTATLTGGLSPTGTITFNLFGPNDATCTGAVAFTATVPVAGNGSYDSPNFTTTAAGVYRFVASYSGDANNAAVGPTACTDPAEAVTVGKVSPTIVTNASAPVVAGGTIHDTATLSGGVNPTGTITFDLFGPKDATCSGAVAFTATVPVAGNGNYDSPDFTATAAGTFRWVASYSGDANNNAAGPTACSDPAETVTITKSSPLVATNASGSVPVGQAISDTATLTGGTNPTGSITFTAFGPNNATCAGPAVFTSTVTVTGNGTYPSGAFTPTVAGTYRFVASYSGDANNNAATTACTDPTEAVVVTRLTPTLTTTASATVGLGGQIRDTATLTGGTSPTGSITFNVFGPNDATCTGAVASTSTATVTGAGAYQSASFTPTAPGTYRFVATYSGDANNAPAGPTACSDPAETVLVRSAPTLTTTASGTVPEGGAISDTATLSGGLTPTGTITFSLFGPGNATCVGTPIFTSTVTVAGNGDYQSGAFTTSISGSTGPGTYRWVATYSGDANNGAAGPTACNDPAEAVVVTNVAPAIQITKTPNPLSLPEPGGLFTFSLVVTNPSPEPVTITSLVDNVYGDLSNQGTCTTAIGTVLAANGGQYMCSFSGNFTGHAPASQTDTVTVTGTDNEGATVTAQASATVTLTGVAPVITVRKTASPGSRPEPGGIFTFSVLVTNTGINSVTITSLVDDVYGDLNGQGTCAIGTTLAPGASYPCTFPGSFVGIGGQTQTDTVTATAVDRNNNQVSAMDHATVAITSVLPSITVKKSVTPGSLPEPGGTFTFSVTVTNTSSEVLRLTTLIDDKYGDLNHQGTCSVPQVLAVGGSYSCTFPGIFAGLGGDSQTDTVTATAVDTQGRQASAMDHATVTITPVPPTITVKKTADPLTKPEPGGDFTFTVVVTNTSPKQVTLTNLVDDKYGDLNGRGTCKTGPTIVLAANGGTYTCSFAGAFTGVGGQSQTDTVTATVVDNRGNQATAQASATVTLTSLPPTITVTKTPDPTTRPAPGGSFTFTVTVKNTSTDVLTVTSLTDNVYGDLNGKGTCRTGGTIAVGGTYTCSFTGTFTGNGGDRQTDTVTATATNPRNQSVTATAQATVSLTAVPVTPTTQVRVGTLARTGSSPGGPTRLAIALVLLGLFLLLATGRWRWRPDVALPGGVAGALDGVRHRWADRTTARLRMGTRGPQPRWRGATVSSRRAQFGAARRRRRAG